MMKQLESEQGNMSEYTDKQALMSELKAQLEHELELKSSNLAAEKLARAQINEERCVCLEALRAEIGGVHASVWLRFLRCAVQRTPSIAVSPADVAVGAGRGTSMQRVHLPPPLQCMQWVHAVDHAYGLETLLKLQLVEVLSLGMPEAELQQVTRLWELQPNLIGEDLERVDALADALTLPS